MKKEKIIIKSFYGALASFFLLQLFGYFIYQSFLFYISLIIEGNPAMPNFGGISSIFSHLFGFFGGIWGLIWLGAFLYFQSKVIKEIKLYFTNNKIKSVFRDLNRFQEVIKLVLALFFLIIFILFIIGYYPFPKNESNYLFLIIYYVFSYLFSLWLTKFIKGIPDSHQQQKTSNMNPVIGYTLAFALCGIFILISFININIFYLFGTVGICIPIIIIISWLLRTKE